MLAGGDNGEAKWRLVFGEMNVSRGNETGAAENKRIYKLIFTYGELWHLQL